MSDKFSPYFIDTKNSYTVNGSKYRTFTNDFETPDDLYETIVEAEERAINIGSTGYRKVRTDVTGKIKYGPCSSPTAYLTIMNEIKPGEMSRRYYQFDQRNNLFDVKNSINDNAREGFDYKEQIFKRTMSNVIFRNSDREGILSYLQKVVFALIESVKQIKNSFNYTVPFNNRRVF